MAKEVKRCPTCNRGMVDWTKWTIDNEYEVIGVKCDHCFIKERTNN